MIPRAPYRPAPIKLLNRVAAPLGRLGVFDRRLTAESLMDTARRRSGLRNFGDESFREPLERLLISVREEARLTALGSLITHGRLLAALECRLRVEELYARHPEIQDEALTAPIVIAGLQRTGTTLLHRLLAAHPDLRWLAAWEALSPAPQLNRVDTIRRSALSGPDPRIRQAKLAERGLRYLAPEFFAIHPVEASAPEEEVLLLDYSFRSTVPEATLRVPSYARWLEQADPLPAYRYLERLLKLLSWQAPAKRWVLKTPHHLEWLDALLGVFPDAKVIQTHRDPTKTLASFCSMIWHGRAVFSDSVDALEVGREWSRKTHHMVTRGMASRQQRGDEAERFLDVQYSDLMRDPAREVERIFEFTGLPVSLETQAALKQAQRKNKQHAHGVHRYALSDFGLTTQGTTQRFREYIDAHRIPTE